MARHGENNNKRDAKTNQKAGFALRTASYLLALAAAYPALNVLALLLHRVGQQLDVL